MPWKLVNVQRFQSHFSSNFPPLKLVNILPLLFSLLRGCRKTFWIQGLKFLANKILFLPAGRWIQNSKLGLIQCMTDIYLYASYLYIVIAELVCQCVC